MANLLHEFAVGSVNKPCETGLIARFPKITEVDLAMLTNSDIQVDSYLLHDGRRVYRMTHIATGVSVEDEPDSVEVVVIRLQKLKERLEVTVADSTKRM